MQKFSYTAKESTSGEVIKSVVQAESERAAAKVLTAQGLIPLDIHEVREGGSIARFFQRITMKDKVVFSRQLATLIEAGLPLAQSLHTVVEQTNNPKMRDVVRDIIVSVEGGRSLGDSFARHPETFSRVFIALVRAGELSGTLDVALHRIAAQQEKDQTIMRRVRGAMVYPAIVLLVIILVVVFMMVTIVPEVAKLYEGLGQQLPFLTAMLIAVSNFLTEFWWAMIAILVVAGYAITRYFKTESGVQLLDKVKLHAPPFKELFRKLYMARFARTAETLLATGVPMLDTLAISSEAVSNTLVGESIDNAVEQVKGGVALSKALKEQPYVLSLVPQMIKIGEKSGQIDQMMGKVASAYEDELDEQVKALSTTIEPILMVVMAVFAGGIVMAILFPIYSLVSVSGGSL